MIETNKWLGIMGNVQVMFTKIGVLVRDRNKPDEVVLAFTPEEWDAFEKGVKAGEFDEDA